MDCPRFHSCGGCVFRHISYDAEKELKRQKVIDAFTRLAHMDVPVKEIITCETERYRNKAQYPVGTDKEGKIIKYINDKTGTPIAYIPVSFETLKSIPLLIPPSTKDIAKKFNNLHYYTDYLSVLWPRETVRMWLTNLKTKYNFV